MCHAVLVRQQHLVACLGYGRFVGTTLERLSDRLPDWLQVWSVCAKMVGLTEYAAPNHT